MYQGNKTSAVIHTINETTLQEDPIPDPPPEDSTPDYLNIPSLCIGAKAIKRQLGCIGVVQLYTRSKTLRYFLYIAGPHRYNQTRNLYMNTLHKKRWTLAQKDRVT